ncbi:MAG: type II toxin-antitoxin system PemK/MazF family toxin [Candidatus Diapherotrites archaeon]|nr:type II toxin-antitoxin system PemK/MazF family toxin [Candidatus Diapherotrites archaeon]
MERFVKGDIVIVPFPFSDLSTTKKRPAFVIQTLKGDDLILCQITSQETSDSYAVPLSEKEFAQGTLKQNSNVRINKLFTADQSLILYKAGHTKEQKTKQIIQNLVKLLESE